MKSLDELILRFQDIQDLPVSEEMLGAYMEGNLIGSEFREVNNIFNDNNFLAEFISNIQETTPIDDLVFHPNTDAIINSDIIDGVSENILQEQNFIHIAACSPDFKNQDDFATLGIATNEHDYSQNDDNVNNIVEDTISDDIFNINS